MSSSKSYIRKFAVAGGFYPRDPGLLRKELEMSFSLGYGEHTDSGEQLPIVGAIVPHAGYTYSGSVASYSYGFLKSRIKPPTIIIVGPNHTGYGTPVSVWPKGVWETPLGGLQVDEQISEKLLETFPDFDQSSHLFEHSIEVQLPFIQFIYGMDVKIVPICVLDQSLQTSIALGDAIAKAISGRPIVLLASSDFSHYVPQSIAEQNDHALIKAILDMNEEKVLSVADNLDVNACGLGPIVTVIHALKILGIGKAQLLKYATSGDVTGNYESVVGYASVVFY
ncbi:MAG TPA: AmmeMemoRadiSam system protein B [bacterium]|nr:AmmeMemoRadiSam system protein B [bacterium]